MRLFPNYFGQYLLIIRDSQNDYIILNNVSDMPYLKKYFFTVRAPHVTPVL